MKPILEKVFFDDKLAHKIGKKIEEMKRPLPKIGFHRKKNHQND